MASLSQKLFSFPNDKLFLHHESLLGFSETSARLRVIAVMGEGRAGKSELANEWLGWAAFQTGNTGEAVTTGVDFVVVNNTAILDIEGLNNALAPSRIDALLIGAALASTLVFVVDGKLSDSSLDLLGRVVAEMQLLQKGTPTRLVLVVNKCTLEYGSDALERALSKREEIKNAFSERYFVTVPFDQSRGESYQEGTKAFKEALDGNGLELSGVQLAKMIPELASQLQASERCELQSLHQQVLARFLEGEVEEAVKSFRESHAEPANYDPDFQVDTSEALRDFSARVQRAGVAQVPELADVEKRAQELREINQRLGAETQPWRDVLRRGCELLASKRIGARLVVQRRQDLSPFLGANVIHLDPPVPLSMHWMWHHFHPKLNPKSHDVAAVLRRDGHVVAVRVAAPQLPPGIQPPRGNARHKAALSVSLRSDAWVAVISEERGEVSVACAGELWDAGKPFPEDANYDAHEQTRRSMLRNLGLLWESRPIYSSASGRLHKWKWVWDGTARDEQSGLSMISKHWKSKSGAESNAKEGLMKALVKQGIIWDPSVASAL